MEVRFRQSRRMHFASESEEPAKVHNQRTPAHWVDMRTQFVAHQQFLIDMELHNTRLRMCSHSTFLPKDRNSCTMPSICTGHSATRGGFTHSELHRSEPERRRICPAHNDSPIEVSYPARRSLAGGKRETIDVRDSDHPRRRLRSAHSRGARSTVIGGLAAFVQGQLRLQPMPPRR